MRVCRSGTQSASFFIIFKVEYKGPKNSIISSTGGNDGKSEICAMTPVSCWCHMKKSTCTPIYNKYQSHLLNMSCKQTNKKRKTDKNCLQWSFISKSLVELYTHLVPGDAFFFDRTLQQQIKQKKLIHYIMVFVSGPFGLYNTNAGNNTPVVY